MTTETLDALANVYRCQLEYERSRAKRIGPRTGDERDEVIRLMRIQRKVWLDLGGREKDFGQREILAELEGTPPSSDAAPTPLQIPLADNGGKSVGDPAPSEGDPEEKTGKSKGGRKTA